MGLEAEIWAWRLGGGDEEEEGEGEGDVIGKKSKNVFRFLSFA